MTNSDLESISDLPVRPRLRTREALGFLATAGETLASSLDPEITLQAVADLAVPRIACYCIVDLLANDGEVQRAAMSHIDPEKDAMLRDGAEMATTAERLSLEPVLHAGETLLIGQLEADDGDAHPKLRERLREIDTQSFIAVPLVARGRTIGALELGSTRTDRFYSDKDLVLAQEVARLAALSIDNARLFEGQREAVQLRDEVLSIVAHDLRNPLNTISMAAALLANPDNARGPKMSELIERSARAMDQLIQDLLDVAKIESGSQIPLNRDLHRLEEIVDEAAAIYRPQIEAKGVTLRVNIEPLPPLEIDRRRILQVFNNLFGNALKFTDEGEIAVEARLHPDGVLVAVSDTGSGIPASEHDRIFDRFWQARKARRGGAGLGLAITRGIVDGHDGRIWVESEEGEGTTFNIILPASASPTSS